METVLVCVAIVILLYLIVPPIIIIGVKIIGGYINWLIDKFDL